MCYWERRSLCFGPDMVDCIDAVHADNFDTAIGHKAGGDDRGMRSKIRVSG